VGRNSASGSGPRPAARARQDATIGSAANHCAPTQTVDSRVLRSASARIGAPDTIRLTPHQRRCRAQRQGLSLPDRPRPMHPRMPKVERTDFRPDATSTRTGYWPRNCTTYDCRAHVAKARAAQKAATEWTCNQGVRSTKWRTHDIARQTRKSPSGRELHRYVHQFATGDISYGTEHRRAIAQTNRARNMNRDLASSHRRKGR